MSSRTRTKVKHRTLWISDVHLGSPGCKAKQLTEFLRRNDCERLYLVGDIFDGWKLKSRFYWTPEHTAVVRTIIAKARCGTKVHYITGNHDDFLRLFVNRPLPLGNIRIANEVVHKTADGRRLLVTHGDAFDEVVRYPWLARAGDLGYDLLMKSNGVVNRVRRRLGLPYWSLSAFTKNRVKAVVQYLSGFDYQVLYRCKRDRLKGVVCGHSHHAEVRPVGGGVTSYNCGDWVESCTALAEDFNGNIHIVYAGSLVEPAREVVEPLEWIARIELPGRLLQALPAAAEKVRRLPLRRRRPASRPPALPPAASIH